MAVDRATGALYVVSENYFNDETWFPNQVAFVSSTDGGHTWSDRIRIDDTPPNENPVIEQAFMPSVEVSDDGTIGVTYYSFQNDEAGDEHSDADVYFIHCHPDLADCNTRGGWSEAIRLTPNSFDYEVAPTGRRGLFLGDYMGLTATGHDFFAFFSVTAGDDPANTLFVPIRGR
jgi:hypothetical protein